MGHDIIHYSFAGHKIYDYPQNVVVLPQDKLNEAIGPATAAAKTLSKNVPSKPFVRNLILRNWFQVREAERVYAVAPFDFYGLVDGGTGWATQMFIGRHNGLACECYVLNPRNLKWYVWGGDEYIQYDPPKPHGRWAGIGTRKLSHQTSIAMVEFCS